MNRNRFRKVLSVVLTGTVLLGYTGCLDLGGGKKAILEAADELASNMVAEDSSELIKNSSLGKKDSETKLVQELLSDESRSDDEIAFFDAVASTVEYEIDEKSIEVKKGEASVVIVFTMADYESVTGETYTNIDDLTKAVKKADTKDIKFTAEFVKDGKEWVADNIGSKKFMQFYNYRNETINLAVTADMIAGMIDKNMSSFWLTSDGIYIDTDLIEYDYYFDPEIKNYAGLGQSVYFTLDKGGAELFRGDCVTIGESTNISCAVEAAELGNKVFEPGQYTINLYLVNDKDGDDELIDSQSIAVESKSRNTNTTTPKTGDDQDGFYYIYDSNFGKYVINGDWADYDGCLLESPVYSTSVKTMGFKLMVKDDCDMELDYCYAYSATADASGLREGLDNPLYTGSCSPSKLSSGTGYEFLYPANGEAKTGYYFLVVFKAGTKDIVMYALCAVL